MDYEPVKEVMRQFYKAAALFTKNFSYPGYTFNEALVLDIIDRHPGIIARDVSEYTAIDSGYLSKILKKLEKNGLVARNSAKRPPFEKALCATKNGHKMAEELELMVDHNITEHLSNLSPAKRKAFFRMIQQFNEELKEILPESSNSHKE